VFLCRDARQPSNAEEGLGAVASAKEALRIEAFQVRKRVFCATLY
jgi:hypothetical protein